MIKRIHGQLLIACTLVFSQMHALYAEGNSSQTFPVVSHQKVTTVVISSVEEEVVKIAARLFASDVSNISGQKPNIETSIPTGPKSIILAGTLGKSAWIDQLIANKQIDVEPIQGKWESWSVQVLKNPFKGVKKALVIIGSDRRATAYGMLELSRMMGVSPWEWWADVTPEQRQEIVLDIENKTYGSPSVKYRGLFINDEDWGLQPWAAKTFEPETGDIGPKTYAKIFELLLRLRANTIWPAMHSCTKPFYAFPENKTVADTYAIVVGTSHCEPMLCNINAEWDSKTMGEWRYDNNAENIKHLFNQRVTQSMPYESIYTMGMRGEHDSPMIADEQDTDEQVKLLEKVMSDQRQILQQKNKVSTNIPQIFIPYKEVLTYYQAGLELPNDISLVWTDDNYGYIRQLSTPEEQKRQGGAGIYYHTSYWGRPHDYLWLNSTNPVLMWEEMQKAYRFNARNIWILNCGDIKPHEYNIELFLDLAWDTDHFKTSSDVKNHMQNWAAKTFGQEMSIPVTNLYYEYYRLAFIRRPEFMGWSQVEPVTKPGTPTLSHIHYGDEVASRIAQYEELIKETESLNKKVPAYRKDAFYELVYYPLTGAANLNLKWLYAYKNRFVASQGRKSAEDYGQRSKEAFARIEEATGYFNKILQNGKWNHIMNMAPRYLPVFSKPTVVTPPENGATETFGLALESYEMEANHDINNSFANVLPVFNAYTKNTYYIDLFLKNKGTVQWKAVPKANWIVISQDHGTLNSQSGQNEQRLWVSIDWDKVPQGENKKEAPLGHDYQLIPPSYKVNSAINFITKDTTITIGISAYNPKFKALEGFHGFVEDKGFISIHAENYSRSKNGKEGNWQILEGLGYSGNVVTTRPVPIASVVEPKEIEAQSPVLEYDFYCFNYGEANIFVQAVPTHPNYQGKGVRCAVSIDGGEPVVLDFQTHGRSNEWKQNVLRNAAIQSVQTLIDKPGRHTLKIWMADPGVMVDQILIDLGGWKNSYSFPPETMVKE